jgi:hypothetical protein
MLQFYYSLKQVLGISVLLSLILITAYCCNNEKTTKDIKNVSADSSIEKKEMKSDNQLQDTFLDTEDSYLDQLVDTGSISEIDQKVNILQNKIDGLCDSARLFLKTIKDTAAIYGLLNSFKTAKNTYQNQLRDESEFVFMSYGGPSTGKEERQAAANGYYYLALKRKYIFLKTILDNAKDNLDPFNSQ